MLEKLKLLLTSVFSKAFSGYISTFISVIFICLIVKLFVEFVLQYVLPDLGVQPLKISDINIHTNGVQHPVSYWTDLGYRPYQEDRYVAISNSKSKRGKKGDENTGKDATSSEPAEKESEQQISMYAIFDGHGGYLASEFCKRYLCQGVLEPRNIDAICDGSAEEVLRVQIRRYGRCAYHEA